MSQVTSLRCLALALAMALALAAVGCKSEPACSGAECTKDGTSDSFESDGPTQSSSRFTTPTAGGLTGTGTKGASNSDAPNGAPQSASTPPADAAESADDAERTILEADVIQLQGDTLYALSRVAGLAVIDVSDPSALRLLGRYRELPAEPFEMYVHDGVALVMFTGWGQYVALEDDTYSWVTTSKLLALDVTDPSAIAQLGSFDVPGSISDSRIVGDILYIVGHEDGYCWRCEQSKPRTAVVSLRVSDPRAVTQVDAMYFDDDMSSWGPKSVSVTPSRMYVAGPEYGDNTATGSTIQVIDISRADGKLSAGAAVPVHGLITSRWQMDEYDGVLRVVSQPPQIWTANGVLTTTPAIQTFQIASATQLSPLGETPLQLPKPETLRSVRFDGERGYAITAEQRDPLFTLDLSDPAHPRQLGAVELPGFIYHMEPRGERLIGLGFDQGNADGAIAVSLFDVKDLAAPKLLSRVNFGGTWANLPADQDRIHKVFRVLDDAGLILVPFSGYRDGGQNSIDAKLCGRADYVGGVQLIDYAADTLKARGTAESTGEARRALLAHDSLLSVSDERVEAFDVSDRDEPARTSQVVLARQTMSALQLDNGVVARMSYDTRTSQIKLDFVANEAAGDPNQSFAELDLQSATTVPGASMLSCGGQISIDQTFVQGSQLQILYQNYQYDAQNGTQTSQSGLLIVDATDPSKPSVVSNTSWTNEQNWQPYYNYYNYGYYGATDSLVRTTHALSRLEANWEATQDSYSQSLRLRVIDVRDPKHVTTTTLPLERKSSYAGLLADGDLVLTSHFEASSSDQSRGRFYIDRFDVSDPTQPKRLAQVNVPGALMHYLGKDQRAITSEQVRVPVRDVTWDDCYERFARADWTSNAGLAGNVAVSSGAAPRAASTPASSGSGGAASSTAAPVVEAAPLGLCTGYIQHLHLVRLDGASATLEDSLELDENEQVYSSSLGDGVVFATISKNTYYGYPTGAVDIACFGPCRGGAGGVTEPASLLVLGGFGSGKLERGQISVEQMNDSSRWWGFWGSPPVYAYGQRALLVGQSDIAVIDASTPSAPSIAERIPLIAPVQSVDMREKTALLTLGAQGVQWLSLE